MSTRPRIYILDAFHPAGVELAARFADVVRWDDPRVREWPDHADGVMVRMTRITASDIARARHLKIICKQGVGFDSIDLDAARAAGIPVSRTPGVNSEAVAEMAFALALAVARRVAEFDRMLRAGTKIERPDYLGVQLHGKTVGVIGMGAIGTLAARKWRGAFDTPIVAYDPHAGADAWPDIPHQRAPSLADLLRAADVVTLHVPLTDETRHMIDAAALALMKPDAILVNVSRGGIVDESALYTALREKQIFGAGLDVFEIEPPPPDSPLLALANLVATPHAAGGTRETQERSARQVAQQVVDVLSGNPAVNRVA